MQMERVERPMFFSGIGSTEIKARNLKFSTCKKSHAVALTRLWHSRLPNTQDGPWMYAFSGEIDDITYVVALWNNPSARGLPDDWIELRRLACAPDAPRNTPSAFLGYMARWFRKNRPDIDRLISYQDAAVHHGTIYKAANWHIGAVAKARCRDRSKNRVGTARSYRKNINGPASDASEKIRWEMPLNTKHTEPSS